MSAPIQIGADPQGQAIHLDIEELLATRLLVQGALSKGLHR